MEWAIDIFSDPLFVAKIEQLLATLNCGTTGGQLLRKEDKIPRRKALFIEPRPSTDLFVYLAL